MIDLKEIGIEHLLAQADVIDEALELLSQPDLIDLIYDDLHIKVNGYGVCSTGYCSNISTVYQCSDLQSSWREDMACASHAREGIWNGIQHRADTLLQLTNGETDYGSALRCIAAGMYSMRSLLLDANDWPVELPANPCAACREGMLEPSSTWRGYQETEAKDAHGVTHSVHWNCSWQCQHCDTRYTGRSVAGSVDRMERTYVSLTEDLGGFAQVWCQNCVDQAKDNEDLDFTNCVSCSNLIIGAADEPLEVYSELHDEHVCQSCYDNGVDCDDCGCTMYNGDYHECDYGEDEDSQDDGIWSYSYKPKPIFHGKPGPYMGFELEVEAQGDRSSGVKLMNDLDPTQQRWYLKHDGSLDWGFEVVTHPHNLDTYHALDWSWLDKLNNMGFRSWNTSSCGLHVHIGLNAFKDDNHQIRFTKFIYDNERQVKRIAGRSSNFATFDSKGKVIPKIKRKWQDPNRYSAVNVQNENTLEVRVFRGSLRKERLLSAIEFTHAVCEYTRDMKVIPKNKPFSWLRFSAFISANDDKYPNLFIIMNETFERAREIDQQEDGDND